MQHHSRPNPDRLLDVVNHDATVRTRGRFKLFFGASAGVGKTYAMLLEANRRLQNGTDVVIGVVETHGRVETAALVEHIPRLALREMNHRGVVLHEFDLEVALARKPSLILMDELAHTNAPGSRHPKRWQDVEELLACGIDVYSTLNVQHLESLNDMVAKLTGIQVRETVSDQFFDEADEIALIDIPSDELLKRLSDGKVYIAPGANKRAAENFFKKTNLIALRELALRRTAERVDAENDALTAAQGQREAQIGQKLLVCVGHDAMSASTIRHARRMASRAKTPWYALYVETRRHERLTERAKLAVERNLRLAERMGARIVRLQGSHAVDEILNYARHHGITRIVVGHIQRPHGFRLIRSSLSHELTLRGAGLEITTVTESVPHEHAYVSFWRQLLARPSSYGWAMAILAACTLMALLLRGMTDPNNLTMVYLTGVVVTAALLGTGPSVFASLFSVAAFNFFFTEPFYTFSIIDPDYYFTFGVMLVASLIVGSLAAKLAYQARQARRREQETAILYGLTRELSSVRGIESMCEVAIQHIGAAFDVSATCYFSTARGLDIRPERSSAHELKEESVARWVIENQQIAGRDTDTLPSAKGLYLPLLSENTLLGALGVIPHQEGRHFRLAEIGQLESFALLIASAFQRALNAEKAEKAVVESEREKLRNALLSSVSHDLRTPLASITGAASSALLLKQKIPAEVAELLDSIHSQATRLAKLVTNLLDATSLESGKLNLNRQPYFIEEVIGAALTRIDAIKEKRRIKVTLPKDLPLIEMDGVLVEQLLVNLLENAVRHTRPTGILTLVAHVEADVLHVSLSDNGTGLPRGDEDRIFEKFYTKGQRMEGNAGLGLAICKGIVMAHGGRIYAFNNQAGGATVAFTLPGLMLKRVSDG